MEKNLALNRALDAVAHIVDEKPPWGEIVRYSSEVMKGFGGGFLSIQSGEIEEFQAFGLDPRALDEYHAHYHSQDILLPTSGPRPPCTWLDTEQILQSLDRGRNAFYQDFMCRHRMPQIVTLMFEETQTKSVCLSIERDRVSDDGEGFFISAPVQRLTRAFSDAIAGRKVKAQEWIVSAEMSFGLFGEAVCLLGQDGFLIHVSPLTGSILESHGHLRIVSGRFWHSIPKVRGLIESAIARVAGQLGSIKLVLPGKLGKTCVFEVARAKCQASLESRPLLLVRLRRGPSRTGTPLGGFCATFGLTEAEAGVLHRLVDGRTPEEIAVEHSVTINTVRKQISNIMDKVGCTRQLDLVRMALAG